MKSFPPAVVPTAYLRLVEHRAPTLSGRSAIGYAVLSDPGRTQLFFAVVRNEGGGNWNREAVRLDAVEAALATIPNGEPFGSKVLRSAFAGRSSNNAPFLAAALVHAGLLAPADGVKHKLARAGDWPAWAAAMLAREGEPVLFPPGAEAAPPEAAPGSPPAEPVADAGTEAAAPRPSKRPKRGGGDAPPGP